MDISGTPNDDQVAAETEAAHREKARESTFLSAVLLFDGTKQDVTARVRNVSAGGMMVDTVVARQQGLGVTITLKNIGEIRGHVAWTTENRMGISFEEEIDPVQARHKATAIEAPGFKRPYVESRRPGLAIR